MGFSTMGAARPSQSPDKRELYFSRTSTAGVPETYDVYRATRETTGDDYGNEMLVVELSSNYLDGDVVVTHEGLRAFFASTRHGDVVPRLYEATRTTLDAGWTVIDQVSTSGELISLGFDVSPDGSTLYVCDYNNPTMLFQLTRTGDAGAFGAKTFVAMGREHPSIAGDLLSLYYDDGSDIYRVTRPEPQGVFDTPERITAGTHASISDDGHTLIYISNGTLRIRECQ